jgi:hypothetical protein
LGIVHEAELAVLVPVVRALAQAVRPREAEG